jgi:hypothetical protein
MKHKVQRLECLRAPSPERGCVEDQPQASPARLTMPRSFSMLRLVLHIRALPGSRRPWPLSRAAPGSQDKKAPAGRGKGMACRSAWRWLCKGISPFNCRPSARFVPTPPSRSSRGWTGSWARSGSSRAREVKESTIFKSSPRAVGSLSNSRSRAGPRRRLVSKRRGRHAAHG